MSSMWGRWPPRRSIRQTPAQSPTARLRQSRQAADRPTIKPADFKTGAVSSKQAGGAYKAPPSNAARGNGTRSGNKAQPETETHPENATKAQPNTNHAGDLQPHQSPPPSTATPIPTRNISNNRKSWLPSKRRITRNSSSSRKKNTSSRSEKLQRGAKTANGATPRSANAAGRTKTCDPAEADGAAPIAAPACTKAGGPSSLGEAPLRLSQNQAYEWAGDDEIRSLPAQFHCPHNFSSTGRAGLRVSTIS